MIDRSVSQGAAESSDQGLQASSPDGLKFRLEPLVFPLLLAAPLKAREGKVFRLEGILQKVVHLPLARHNSRDVVVLRQFVAFLADADDVVGWRRIGGRRLARLVIVVGEYRIVLHRPL